MACNFFFPVAAEDTFHRVECDFSINVDPCFLLCSHGPHYQQAVNCKLQGGAHARAYWNKPNQLNQESVWPLRRNTASKGDVCY